MLRVVATGSLFRVYFNGQPLYDVEDATFTGAGTIGVWTKADSVTYFDELQVVVKSPGQAKQSRARTS